MGAGYVRSIRRYINIFTHTNKHTHTHTHTLTHICMYTRYAYMHAYELRTIEMYLQ